MPQKTYKKSFSQIKSIGLKLWSVFDVKKEQDLKR